MAGQIANVFTNAEPNIVSGTIDLVNDTFYYHLVTTVPNLDTDTAVSDLVLANYTGYASEPMVSSSLTNGLWVIDPSITFNPNTGASQSIIGTVICKQLGGSPSATDTPVVFLHARLAGNYVSVNVNTNTAPQIVTDQTNGVLEVNLGLTGYATGSYSSLNDTNGAIYLIATEAGGVTWTEPVTANKIGVLSVNSGDTLVFDRNTSTQMIAGAGNSFTSYDFIIDFGVAGNLINLKNSTCVMLHRIFTGTATFNISMWGAHKLVSGVSSDSDIQWDALGSFSFPSNNNSNLPYRTEIISIPGNDNFYRYVRFNMENPGFNFSSSTSWEIREIEFYDAVVGRNVAW